MLVVEPTKKRRKEEWLKPLEGSPKRKKIACFDIEAKDADTQRAGFTRPFLVDFYDGEEHFTYRNEPILWRAPWKERHLLGQGCIDRMCRMLFDYDPLRPGRWTSDERLEQYQSKHFNIYAHNGGNYDLLFLIGWLKIHDGSFRYEIVSVQAKILQLRVYRIDIPGNHEWTFLDSMSLLPMSLKKAGKTFCPEDAQKMSMDLELHEDDPKWEVYNRIDNEVLYVAMSRFHDLVENDLGGEVGMTAASTAMKLFRRRFQQTWIRRSEHWKDCDGKCDGRCGRRKCDGECHGCLHKFVREGYYGGRTEVFRRHGKGVVYFDINSSYPASMLEPMPVGNVLETGPISLKMAKALASKRIGFVEATVEIPEECDIPPLPVRHNGKLVFPAGRFRGVWDWRELELLNHPRVNGKILEIHKGAWYRAKPIFQDMVLTLYSYRKKHLKGCQDKSCKGCNPKYSDGLSFVAKLMLNSCYGKFGMNQVRDSIVVEQLGVRRLDGRPTNGDPDACTTWLVENIVEAPYIIPQIAAHVTALSRIKLFMGMMQVVDRGGYVLYTDTDSITTNVVIEQSEELGAWKQEEAGTFLSADFILPKFYRLMAHKPGCKSESCEGCLSHFHHHSCKDEKCKGCAPSKHRMKGIPSDAQNADSWSKLMDHQTIKFKRLSKHRTMLRKGLKSPEVTEFTKSVRSQFDKRIMLPDGTTKPLVIGMDRKDRAA